MPGPDPPPRIPRRRGALGRRVGFSLLLLLAGLLGTEGTLRLLGWPTQQVRTMAWLLEQDPARFAASVGVFRPSTRGRVAWPPQLAYDVQINALGLRGEEVPPHPAPGTRRILVLGDSGTFGFYVREDETLPARLQQLLRAEGLPVEVLNGGCGGWSIDSETQFLEERAIGLRPHLVLLVYCSNDIADLRGPISSYEGLELRRAAGSPLRRALEATAVHELAWRLKGLVRGRRPRPLTSDGLDEPERVRLWARYEGWLARLRAFLALRGIPLVVHYQPDAWKLQNGLPATDERELRAVCARAGVELVSPVSAFQRHRVEETFLLPLDPHPSPLGYLLQARALARRLQAHPRLTR